MSPYDQAHAFLAMVLCGACIAMIHDMLGLLRRGKILTALADIFLGFLAAAGIAAAGLRLRCDPFRLYVFGGAALGFAIYRLSLGTIVRILTKRFIELSKKVTN